MHAQPLPALTVQHLQLAVVNPGNLVGDRQPQAVPSPTVPDTR